MRKNTVAVNTQSNVLGQVDMMMKNTYMGLTNKLAAQYIDTFCEEREEYAVNELGEETTKKVPTQAFIEWMDLCGKFAKSDALVLTLMCFDAPFPEAGTYVDPQYLLPFVEGCMETASTLNNNLAKAWNWTRFVQRDAQYYVDLFIKMGYMDEEYMITNKFWTTIPLDAVLPQNEYCTKENRRFGYVKSGVKMSPLMWNAVRRLQDEAFFIDEVIFDIYNAYSQMPAKFKEEEYVIQNSIKLIEEFGLYAPLYSEWGGDARARLYMLACASANPQTSDLARSLYSHTVPNFVDIHSDAYNMFLEEMAECAGPKGWMKEERIRRIAANPAEFLVAVYSDMPAHQKPAKPFTFIRLCKDWVKFQDNGKCDSRVAFGLDAKNSGTQYLAILAGDANISAATGVTICDPMQRVKDPYVQSLDFLKRRVSESNMKMDLAKLTRSLVKTPYMAIQYRGTVNALLNSSDWVEAMVGTGLFNGVTSEKAKDMLAMQFSATMVDSIYDALGDNIMRFIEDLEGAVRYILETNNITHFDYAMTDGFVVSKPCYEKWTVAAPEAVRINKNGGRAIFGDMKKDKAWQVTNPNPSGEEFIRTFMVNYIQGMDALVARTWVEESKSVKMRGVSTVHDCFRCCLADAPMMKPTIANTYKSLFVGDGSSVNLQLEHLANQLIAHGAPKSLFQSMQGFNPVAGIGNADFVMTMDHENSYYFCM